MVYILFDFLSLTDPTISPLSNPACPLQELSAVLAHNHSAPLGVEEQVLALDHIRLLDSSRSPIHSCEDARRGQQLQSIPHADLAAMLADLFKGAFGDIETLGPCAQPDDRLDLVWRVSVGGDDEKAGEEVCRDAVGGCDVVGAADDRVAAIRGQDHDGRDGGFKRPVKIRKAFDIEHVDLEGKLLGGIR